MEEKVICQCCGIEHYKRECQRCGKIFNATNPRNILCSLSCMEKKRYSKKKEKTCEICGKVYLGKRASKKCESCTKNSILKLQSNGGKAALKAIKNKYGVDNPMYLDRVKNKFKTTCKERYGVDRPLQSKEVRKKIKATCQEKYGVDWACMRPEYRSGARTISSVNKYFGAELGEGVEYEFSLESYSYDIKYNNTLIDIHPYPYHNLTWNPFGKTIKEDYHQKRADTAHQHGYQYIALFDRDDRNKVISMLKQQDKKKYYARKLEVREVDPQVAKNFLITYHLQSDIKGNNYIPIGLFDGDELVMLTTRGTPRYTTKYHYELLRLCTRGNAMVIGGFKKLLNYFIETYNPLSVISYCDMSKFNGSVYKDSGFAEKKNQPSLHFYNPLNNKHFTHNFLKRKGFDLIMGGTESLVDTILGFEIFRVRRKPDKREDLVVKKGEKIPLLNEITEKNSTDNRILMEKFGFVVIPDCGQTTYTLSLENKK